MNNKTSGRKNIELLVVVLLLNIAAISCFAFLFRDVKAKNEHISSLVNQIEAEQSEENLQDSIKTLVAETTPLREKLANYFIGQEAAVSFLELLEQIGREVGATVEITSVAPSDIQQEDVESLRLMLQVTGEWSEVVRFIGLIELLPFEGKIEQVVVFKTEAGSEEPWQADITFIALKEK